MIGVGFFGIVGEAWRHYRRCWWTYELGSNMAVARFLQECVPGPGPDVLQRLPYDFEFFGHVGGLMRPADQPANQLSHQPANQPTSSSANQHIYI